MYLSGRSFYWPIIVEMCSLAVVKCAKLTAVSYSVHARRLYQEVGNSDPPSEGDPAFSDARVRKSICDDITRSGLFHLLGFVPVSIIEIHRKQSHPKYSEIFRKIFTIADDNSPSSFTYDNDYKFFEFNMLNSYYHLTDYVFVCPMKSIGNDNIIPFHVTKEYNVSTTPGQYKPGRFVLKNFMPRSRLSLYLAILAEESATNVVFREPNFNVELFYLHTRKYVQPAESNEVDPLCKLVSTESDDPNNQHYRFCVAIFRSSKFKNVFEYPRRKLRSCLKMKVSFRTRKAAQLAAQRSYHERMVVCQSAYAHVRRPVQGALYISRAYKSNRVFVYRQDRFDGKVYLQNLSVNMGITDELNSFDFVED